MPKLADLTIPQARHRPDSLGYDRVAPQTYDPCLLSWGKSGMRVYAELVIHTHLDRTRIRSAVTHSEEFSERTAIHACM